MWLLTGHLQMYASAEQLKLRLAAVGKALQLVGVGLGAVAVPADRVARYYGLQVGLTGLARDGTAPARRRPEDSARATAGAGLWSAHVITCLRLSASRYRRLQPSV